MKISHISVLLFVCGHFTGGCDGGEAPPVPTQGGAAPSTTHAGGTPGSSQGGGGRGGEGGGAPICTDDPTICQDDTPVCANGACVECAPGAEEACTGDTPSCNPATFTCEGCRYHAQCPGSACNVFTGSCLSASPVTVGPDASDDHDSLAAALADVGPNEEAVLLISPGEWNYPAGITVAGGRTIALLGHHGRAKLGSSDASIPTLSVLAGSTLLVEGLDLRNNNNAAAVQASGRVALDRVAAVNGGGGVETTSSAELVIRNTMIYARFAAEGIALSGTLELVNTTVGANIASSVAIRCAAGHQLVVRNSILYTQGDGPVLASCDHATITHSAGSDALDGQNNTTFPLSSSLFVSLDDDLRLTTVGKATFAGAALWQVGDPPTDIDGGPRPTTDGPDVAGAHLGP